MVKQSAITWTKDIKQINITEICRKYEEKSQNQNVDWFFTFDHNRLEEMTKKFWEELNFVDLDITYRYGNPVWYWHGVFTAEPWCDLHEQEEVIMDWIKKDFLRIVKNEEGDTVIQWINNSKAKLYRFFLKEYPDGESNRTGYGGNIVSSINGVLTFAEKWMTDQIGKNAESWGAWEESKDDDDCERERDEDGWQCLHDCTGCIYNDGHNTCTAPR